MDIVMQWATSAYHQALALWYSLGPEGSYFVWVASGILGLIAILLLSYRMFRWALGHRKFRGHWYDPERYHGLMQMLHEEQLNNRVLAYEELAALRAYKYGKSIKPLTPGKTGGYSD
jgi:hypothetical protein